MYNTVGMVSLGCAKNQVDAEVMLGLLKREGLTVVQDPAQAEVILINTCGFIGPAKEESIQAILEHAPYKEHGICKALVVTGCLAERYAKELQAEMPEVDAVVGTANYTGIFSVLREVSAGARRHYIGDVDRKLVEDLPRVISTGTRTAYLKIAEGCDNHCSYCIIPALRGAYRSRSMVGLVQEAHHLAEQGIRELIIIAQDITRYGQDLKGEHLTALLKALIPVEGLHWLRLLYCYPDRIDDALLDLMAAERKILPYLDIPIQHMHPRILKAMNRSAGPETVTRLLERIHARMPEAVLRTSLIAGFPGETEAEFQVLLDFVGQGWFDHVGVFVYSSEEDTPAADLPDQIPEALKEERREKLLAAQRNVSKAKRRARLGQTCQVLLEGREGTALYYGRSYGEAPGVDGLVYVFSETPLTIGTFVPVKLTKAYEYDLLGELDYDESSQ